MNGMIDDSHASLSTSIDAIGQLKGNYNFNFGPNQTPSPRITTLRDLMIDIWDYCALNPRFTVPVLALLLGLFGYQNYASDGLGGIFGSHGNSTGWLLIMKRFEVESVPA
ncbi:hypothetical protein POM88_034330 [Heracleum sosnowskyi]|uniref:Uncharacterized protein n=1 Tax=Heracleum sosnowskyi TaxID=360622 RepID=A0AAD8MDH7_9APIA|nr:hypothetical protein POM88_034330 [Heracleum sosnowskyi]